MVYIERALMEQLENLAIELRDNPKASSLLREVIKGLRETKQALAQLRTWNDQLRVDKVYAEQRARDLEYEVHMLRAQVKY